MTTILESLRQARIEKQFNQNTQAAQQQPSPDSQKLLTGVYRCRVCGYIFDESAEGRSIDTLEQCPLCHVGREAFQQIR